jgi:hypothetical protein
MRIITFYAAEDGKQFRDSAQCLEYEQQCKDALDANEMLENGATLMAVLTRANQTRPWWDSGLTLEDKVSQIDNNERIFLCGRSHYSYGEWICLQDLLRYAHETATQRD